MTACHSCVAWVGERGGMKSQAGDEWESAARDGSKRVSFVGGRGWTDLTSQHYAVKAGVGAYHDVGLRGSAADARGRVLLQPLEVSHETLARGCAHGAHLPRLSRF